MNGERSDVFAGLRRAEEVRGQRSGLNPVKGRGPNGALRPQLSLELHIEELVLHGFAPGERYAIGETVEHELALLLGEQGVPNSLRVQSATDEIKGATFQCKAQRKAARDRPANRAGSL